MQRDVGSFIDIIDSARRIQGYVEGRTLHDLLEDVGLQDQVVRRFGIIGEAARRLSDEARRSIPGIPWPAVIGLRNVLIHDYAEVDCEELWDIIQNHLPRLIDEIEPLVPPPPDASPQR